MFKKPVFEAGGISIREMVVVGGLRRRKRRLNYTVDFGQPNGARPGYLNNFGQFLRLLFKLDLGFAASARRGSSTN